MQKDRSGKKSLKGLSLTLTAAGALIGGSFLGAVSANVDGNAGTYALNTLPDFYGSSDFSRRAQHQGERRAQRDSAYCEYYGYYYYCCYNTESGQYCCYYYGYYYCYDSNGKTSENMQNDFGGFAGGGSPAEAAPNISAFF